MRELDQAAGRSGDLLADQANELVIGRTEGNGVLYYTAHLTSYLPVPEDRAAEPRHHRRAALHHAGQRTTPITEADGR